MSVRISLLRSIVCSMSYSLFAQTSSDFHHANQLVMQEKYSEAKNLYLQHLQAKPTDTDALYNLAICELKLEQPAEACARFAEMNRLGDTKVVADLKQFCPDFTDFTWMLLEQVDELPQFTLDGVNYPLYVETKNGWRTHEIYGNMLKKAVLSNPTLLKKVNGNIIVQYRMNEQGRWDILRLTFDCHPKARAAVQAAFVEILETKMYTTPARYKDKAVGLREVHRFHIHLSK